MDVGGDSSPPKTGESGDLLVIMLVQKIHQTGAEESQMIAAHMS